MAIARNFKGWTRDPWDPRDRRFSAPSPNLKYPRKADIYRFCQPMLDQGSLGSCTAHMAVELYMQAEFERFGKTTLKSRLATYWWTRLLMGTLNEDSGATIRLAIKSLAKFGACEDSLYPNDAQRFVEKPSEQAIASAKQNIAVQYARVPHTADGFRDRIMRGDAIGIGFDCFDSLMSHRTLQTGIIPMPKRGEQSNGGHAVVIVAYDDDRGVFVIKNSWGNRVGLSPQPGLPRGYFEIPMEYLLDPKLSADPWALMVVT